MCLTSDICQNEPNPGLKIKQCTLLFTRKLNLQSNGTDFRVEPRNERKVNFNLEITVMMVLFPRVFINNTSKK